MFLVLGLDEFMSLIDAAKRVAKERQIADARKARPKHPTGYEPGLDTAKNEITGRWDHPLEESEYEDAFTELLKEWGFDPNLFAIEDDRVEIRTWDAHYGVDQEPKRFWYYKARVVRKRPKANIEELVKRIRSRKAIEKKPAAGERAFVVVNTDWQLGKRDGEGTAFTIQAVKNSIPRIKARYKALMKEHDIDTLVMANLGDLVEGCVGFYPMQTFEVELSRREQVRLGRELITEQILAWADDFQRVIVITVAGNHGEFRNNAGQAFTNLGDNDDIAMVEQVADAFKLASDAGSDRYDHIRFMIPDNQLSVTLDIHGTIVGITHGHVAGRRPTVGKNLAHTKVWDWWYGQSMGRQPIADADLLLSGHFHYLSLIHQGKRTALQAPPLDNASEWYVDSQGLKSHAATLTLVVGGGVDEGEAGWSDLHVMTP